MMTEDALEPGLLQNFRLFAQFRLALLINSLLLFGFMMSWAIRLDFWILILITVLDAVLLLLYLSVPPLITLLKKGYLPIAIIWATLGPMVEIYLGLIFVKTNLIPASLYFMAPLPILAMFIPLVIVAWQYSKRAIFYFCGLTMAADFIFAILELRGSDQIILMIVCLALIRTVLFLLAGNMINNLITVQREQRYQLIEANERLVQYAQGMEQLTISRERNRMARELHDLMAHTMSGVAVELEGASSMLAVNPEKAEKLLNNSLSAVRGGLMETRRALQALRSSPLEDLGLGLAIRNLVETLPNRAKFQLDVQIDDIQHALPDDVQQCFYRVAQEALNNTVAHAEANTILIRLQQEGTILRLSIRDNGIGFTEEAVRLEEKYGLLGMRERAEMIHGNLVISSQPGSGTQVELTYGGPK